MRSLAWDEPLSKKLGLIIGAYLVILFPLHYSPWEYRSVLRGSSHGDEQIQNHHSVVEKEIFCLRTGRDISLGHKRPFPSILDRKKWSNGVAVDGESTSQKPGTNASIIVHCRARCLVWGVPKPQSPNSHLS